MTFINRKRVVGVSDYAVSGDIGDLLITHALGSCLGIAIHDPVNQVGGLLHAMLPLASFNRVLAASSPAMFVDSGMDLLLSECERLGARRRLLAVTAAGGADFLDCAGRDAFRVGQCNILELRHTLRRHGLSLGSCKMGGRFARTVSLSVGNGEVVISENRLPPRAVL